MDKIIHLEPYFPKTGEITVQPAVISYKGKFYTEEISKYASVGQDYLSTIQPVPGHSFVYVLAVSSWETYGENRNGDAFPEFPFRETANPPIITANDVLTRHYKSFEEHGHVFMHHVNRDPVKSCGKVVRAFWNPSMHRVELLLDVENERTPNVIERITAGEFPAVSMGCRVKFDYCSICYNQAPTRAQYCEHLKFNMRQPFNGVIAAALNPSPVFFDISFVVKPADVTAYMMKKVANELPYELSGAAAGEYIDEMRQLKEAAHKMAVIDKVVQGLPVDAKADTLNSRDLYNIQQIRPTALDLAEEIPALPDPVLHGLSEFPLQKIFSTLFASGMQLSSPEVIKIVIFRSRPQQEIPSCWVDRTVALQNSLFRLFEDCPQIPHMLGQSSIFKLGTNEIEPKVAQVVLPYMEKRSGVYHYLRRNLVPEQFREEAPYTTPYTLTDPATGQGYMTTRGAAIRAHDEIAKRNLYKILGGAALLGTTYKLLGSGLTRAGYGVLKPLLGVSLGGLGISQWPNMGPHYLTDQGIPIPTSTEIRPVKQASLVLPAFGTLAAMALMGHDYKSRLQAGEPVGHPALPLSRRVLDNIEAVVTEHPFLSAAGGTLIAHQVMHNPLSKALYSRVISPLAQPVAQPIKTTGQRLKKFLKEVGEEEKLSSYISDAIEASHGTVEMPRVDLDKVAEKLGELIVEG